MGSYKDKDIFHFSIAFKVVSFLEGKKEDDDISQTLISRKLLMGYSTASLICAELVKKGFVKSNKVGRNYHMELTKKGVALLDAYSKLITLINEGDE